MKFSKLRTNKTACKLKQELPTLTDILAWSRTKSLVSPRNVQYGSLIEEAEAAGITPENAEQRGDAETMDLLDVLIGKPGWPEPEGKGEGLPVRKVAWSISTTKTMLGPHCMALIVDVDTADAGTIRVLNYTLGSPGFNGKNYPGVDRLPSNATMADAIKLLRDRHAKVSRRIDSLIEFDPETGQAVNNVSCELQTYFRLSAALKSPDATKDAKKAFVKIVRLKGRRNYHRVTEKDFGRLKKAGLILAEYDAEDTKPANSKPKSKTRATASAK